MDWHTLSTEKVLEKLNVNPKKGLNNDEVKKRQLIYGKNALPEEKRKSFGAKLMEQISDFMVIILISAAGISFFTSFLSGKSDYIDTIIILAIVIINSTIGILQETKAEKEIDSLKHLSTSLTKVIRNSEVKKIPTEDIVPGDILSLSTGNIVCADARIIKSSNLAVEESAITGESFATEKNESKIYDLNTPLADRKNMLYTGSIIDRGRALAVAVETGAKTETGKVQAFVNSGKPKQTPLQIKLSHTSKIIGIIIMIISIIVFFLGAMQKVNLMEMFMISISLAVAAIPEGLPAVVTIVLANGVRRMAKNNTIVRKLPAVETLGHATVICSDKTGTLTMNKMLVTEIRSTFNKENLNSHFAKKILKLGVLCNNSSPTRNHGEISAQGEPTENALLIAGEKSGIHKKDLEKIFPRISEIPFDSKRKMMTTLHKTSENNIKIISKGAPDIILEKCSYYIENEKIKPLSQKIIQKINFQIDDMASKSLRTLAFAFKNEKNAPENSKIEKNLIFCGVIGIIDPPRPEANYAVNTCKSAGIRTIMITGDHKNTAQAIAEQVGISSPDSKVITGTEINKMSDNILKNEVKNCHVFARISPEHKVRIIKALQANGEIVAMTGDGVNDAPALKAADIGCAMGKSGTDAAKSASDIILADDNFTSVVETIRQGRGMYDNIKKTIHFLLSTNIGEAVVVLLGFLLRLPSPLLAIHLLWINLVTDAFPALALGMDPIDKNIMKRFPNDPKKSLFSNGLGYNIIIEGCFIASVGLLAFSIGRVFFDSDPFNPIIGRTMSFVTLGLSQLIQTFNVQSRKSLFITGFFSNLKLVYSVVLCMFLQIIVITLPMFTAFFKVSPLSNLQWAIVWILALFPLIISETEKFFKKKLDFYILFIL